jgi:hypothetical protein
MKNLGNGIVLFNESFNVDGAILDFLNSLQEVEFKNNYTYEFNDDNSIKCLVNKSGHRFRQEDISKSCVRLSNYYNYPNSEECINFFNNCDSAVYEALLEYLEIFPMLLPCIWWKTKGHPIFYPEGSEQGIHCDNDINYSPGFEPSMQLGSRHVLAAMCYLNDDFSGGEIVFPYAGVTHFPKAGDVLLFPANYICAHYVATVTSGERYAYLQYFGQGSSSPEYGISVCDNSPYIHSGQVWMNDIFSDYKNHIEMKYQPSESGDFLRPLQRKFHSSEIR